MTDKNSFLGYILLFLFFTTIIFSKFPEFHSQESIKNSEEKIKGSELLQSYYENSVYEEIITLDDEEPIFWDLSNGSTITYNPVVLFVNYYYWDSLWFYNDSLEYIFEMYANGVTIFDSYYEYSRYNEYYWELGYDWNISQYSVGTDINLTAYFYQENNPNLNHSASITVTIGDLRENPSVDFESFDINLFHWPGSFYSGGYYYFYNPSGPNAYYHFQIFEDGYVELKYGDLELYDSSDLSSDEAKILMQELIDLGFFQLKDAYFAPGYDYYYSSYYQIHIESQSTDEWRQAEEASLLIVKPQQYANCLNAITNRVSELYFTPKRWRWELFLIVTGSIFGGVGVVATSIYLIFAYRRRR